MDELAEDGMYHYSNESLGFSLALPQEFMYYQTQKTTQDKYTDLEIYVPTSDKFYPQDILGYAKPVVIRVFTEKIWNDEIKDDGGYIDVYQKIGEKGGSIYTIRFWNTLPVDWQTKWTEEMRLQIFNGFKIL